MEGSHKRKKIGDGTWVFSLYNVYGRKNAYSVFYKPNAVGRLRPYQLSIIGTVLPSISYNITF
jgi:ferric enterobactin receptor